MKRFGRGCKQSGRSKAVPPYEMVTFDFVLRGKLRWARDRSEHNRILRGSQRSNFMRKAQKMTLVHLCRFVFIFFLALITVSCGGSGDSQLPTAKFSASVSFGANLTDTGNACPPSSPAVGCPPVPPYAPGVYSNGALFNQIIAEAYFVAMKPSREGGTAFSVAGAQTGLLPGVTSGSSRRSMVEQVDEYLTRSMGKADSQVLYIIDAASFANNILAGLTLISSGSMSPEQLVIAGVADVEAVIKRLYVAGARHFLVVNMPNIGQTPLARSQGSASAGYVTQLSSAFNGNFMIALQDIERGSMGINIYLVDLFSLESQVKANPDLFGLNNVTEPCFTPAALCGATLAMQNAYFYWDEFHPTNGAHLAIAKTALGLLGQ